MLVASKNLGLDTLGITGVEEVHRNLSIDRLIEETVNNGEGVIWFQLLMSFQPNAQNKKIVSQTT